MGISRRRVSCRHGLHLLPRRVGQLEPGEDGFGAVPAPLMPLVEGELEKFDRGDVNHSFTDAATTEKTFQALLFSSLTPAAETVRSCVVDVEADEMLEWMAQPYPVQQGGRGYSMKTKTSSLDERPGTRPSADSVAAVRPVRPLEASGGPPAPGSRPLCQLPSRRDVVDSGYSTAVQL